MKIQITKLPSNTKALGGVLQANGSDWSDGLITIGAGGTHESNPYGGIQLGVDNQNIPNLVEENEVVYDGYVYSNRIACDSNTKKLFHIGNKKEITYADLAKKLEKEIKERPNDPISQAGFRAQMGQLADEQERQKAEMEAERAREAFESLSDEEKVALMERMQEEATARENLAAPTQGEGNVGIEGMGNEGGMVAGSPEGAAMMQQPVVDTTGTGVNQEYPMMAEGGHLFAKGGRYLWDKFWTPVNEYSKKEGSVDSKYQIDKTYKGDIKKLENSEAYKAFTDYILNNATDDERLKYFQWIDANTGKKNKYLKDGKLVEGWQDAYKAARNDGLYGIQHYTPEWLADEAEVAVSAPAKGGQVYIAGNNSLTPVDESAIDDTYTIEDFDGVKIARKKPVEATQVAGQEVPAAGGEGEEFEPKHRWDVWRYAGLMGPAVGLGMQLAGVGKPNYSGLNAAVARGNGAVDLAGYQPIGDYMKYDPFDTLFYADQLQANARATDRALMNSASPARAAGLLANAYNTTNALGNLYRQAEEYNLAQREKVAGFNRGTNMFNAQAYNQNSQFNADAKNRARQYGAQLAMQAEAQKLDDNARWYNSLYGNIGGLFEGISDLGRENAEHNRVADMVASGVFGTPNKYMRKRYIKKGKTPS